MRSILDEILGRDTQFRYMLLDRVRIDCVDYLENGNRDIRRLWAGDEQLQIDAMKAIWNSFSKSEKPKWLTWEQIENFENDMLLPH